MSKSFPPTEQMTDDQLSYFAGVVAGGVTPSLAAIPAEELMAYKGCKNREQFSRGFQDGAGGLRFWRDIVRGPSGPSLGGVHFTRKTK